MRAPEGNGCAQRSFCTLVEERGEPNVEQFRSSRGSGCAPRRLPPNSTPRSPNFAGATTHAGASVATTTGLQPRSVATSTPSRLRPESTHPTVPKIEGTTLLRRDSAFAASQPKFPQHFFPFRVRVPQRETMDLLRPSFVVSEALQIVQAAAPNKEYKLSAMR